jgi:hypothetical protein
MKQTRFLHVSSWQLLGMYVTRGLLNILAVKLPHYRPGHPLGFQGLAAARFSDNWHMNVVRLSVVRTGRLYPQEIFLILFSVRGWVDPRDIVRPEGLCQWKIPMTQTGNEPATFGIVEQCLNQLRRCVCTVCTRYKVSYFWRTFLVLLTST